MFMWTIQKFVDPEHAIKIYEGFYYIAGLESIVMYAIGVAEVVILLLFLAGYKKKYTYGDRRKPSFLLNFSKKV